MQINRLFEIVYLLLNKESLTAGQLAKNFEVSTRTIYRDVEFLSSAGIPIYMTKGKGGGISLMPDFVLNKAVLTGEEKANILASLHAVNSVSLSQTNTAVEKLSSLFGSSDTDWVEVDFSDWANSGDETQIFESFKTAIIYKQVVKFLYHSSEGSVYREVEPIRLCFKGQGWYLYGFCRLRNDFRFFKLRRVKELELLPQAFQRQVTGKIFKGNKVFEEEFVTIKMKISPKMAFRVYDEFEEYEQLPSGDFITKHRIPRGEWVYHYIATFGEFCEVLEPEDVREEIKNKLENTLKQYS